MNVKATPAPSISRTKLTYSSSNRSLFD